MKSRNSELIKLVLENTSNPFQKDINSKSARSIRGLAIGRKFIWKKEKEYIFEHIINQDESEKEGNKKWINYIF